MDRMDADEMNGKKIVMDTSTHGHGKLAGNASIKKSANAASDTTVKLLGSPSNARRLRGAIASRSPDHLVFESMEDLKRALGIQAT